MKWPLAVFSPIHLFIDCLTVVKSRHLTTEILFHDFDLASWNMHGVDALDSRRNADHATMWKCHFTLLIWPFVSFHGSEID
ncbi:hypothetical protein LX32DRAFT_106637 [Colletotrichum zoysiae]|uniref:Uncharacterized protein n=1 Tax=Colletotrichum zoysiae TaxID=1216348 RepID=A0AAD9HQH7_9PEZI|nr:hypothetical protein LX32DRAFT_106637 [Colletotrichum zoysiae]